jgi:hypothetical protein
VNDDARLTANSHYQPWTEADELMLVGDDLSVRELAELLGRTYWARGQPPSEAAQGGARLTP